MWNDSAFDSQRFFPHMDLDSVLHPGDRVFVVQDGEKLNDGILKTNPNNVEALIARGRIWLLQGRASDSVPVLHSAVKIDPSNASGHYYLGTAYAATGYPEQARTAWEDAATLQPGMVETQEALAKLGLEQNDLDLAMKSAEALVKAQPALPAGYNARAVVKARRRDVAGAEADLKKAIALAPQDPIAYSRLGEIRTLQKVYPEAEKLFERALEVGPSFTEALAGISQIYALEKKPPSALLNRVQAQITRAPNNSVYYQMLGQTLVSLHDFEKAESAFEKAVELDHNNLAAFVMLATTQEARGSLAQALASAQRSVQLRSVVNFTVFLQKWPKIQHSSPKCCISRSIFTNVASALQGF